MNGFIWPVVEGTFIYLAGFDGAAVSCADREAQSSCYNKVMFLDSLERYEGPSVRHWPPIFQDSEAEPKR